MENVIEPAKYLSPPKGEINQTEANDAIEKHLKEILILLGRNPDEEGLQETPKRVRQYFQEFHTAFNPKALLGTTFDAEGNQSMVVQSRIPFRMACEHHLLPAWGHAAIGYIPNERVIGLSKLARLVDAVGIERPSIQEGITERIAKHLSTFLKPLGTIVTISAEHSCMACRGVNTPGVVTTTCSIHGVFRDVPSARAEFFSLVHQGV